MKPVSVRGDRDLDRRARRVVRFRAAARERRRERRADRHYLKAVARLSR